MTDKLLPQGGSDIMLDGLKKHVNLDGINIIQSVCDERYIDLEKKNILWEHIPADQPLVQKINDKYFQRQLDATVFVSHWQHEKYRWFHRIPLENTVVIKNAIEPIEYIKRTRSEKTKIVFASPPYRGLNVMLDAFAMINRDDVELDVYSSTIIYGSDYAAYEGDKYDELFNRAKQMKNVNYLGYVPHSEMINALQKADIFAYPCIFEETSCLTMIEAGAAGCRLVATNIGALPETGSEFARLVTIQETYEGVVASYAKTLLEEIESISSFDGAFQSDFYNRHYNWESKAKEWDSLLSKI